MVEVEAKVQKNQQEIQEKKATRMGGGTIRMKYGYAVLEKGRQGKEHMANMEKETARIMEGKAELDGGVKMQVTCRLTARQRRRSGKNS